MLVVRPEWMVWVALVMTCGVSGANPARAEERIEGSIVIAGPIANGCVFDARCQVFMSACHPALAERHGLGVSVARVTEARGRVLTYAAVGDELYRDAYATTWVTFLGATCRIVEGGIPEPGMRLGESASLPVPAGASWVAVAARSARDVSWSMAPASPFPDGG